MHACAQFVVIDNISSHVQVIGIIVVYIYLLSEVNTLLLVKIAYRLNVLALIYIIQQPSILLYE